MPETLVKHYVTFCSPGTFSSEQSTKEIDSWDVEKAMEMARSISERYNATPYGFYFTSRERGPDDFDSKESKRDEHFYWLGGVVETYDQVVARNDPDEEILRSNMHINGYDKVIINTNSWKFTSFFDENRDVLLDWKK